MYHNHRFQDNFVEIIENTNNAYEGNLRHYFGLAIRDLSANNPYHGFRHSCSVTRICYRACRYYVGLGQMTRRRARSLLIGSLLHDYGNPGFLREDYLNIEVAIRALHRNVLEEDRPFLPEIDMIIEATQYPHKDYGADLTLEQAIIRDADSGQALGDDWISDILVGLGKEMAKSPYEMLAGQESFLRGIHFYSEFGQKYFGQEAIDARIKEVNGLIVALKQQG